MAALAVFNPSALKGRRKGRGLLKPCRAENAEEKIPRGSCPENRDIAVRLCIISLLERWGAMALQGITKKRTKKGICLYIIYICHFEKNKIAEIH
jgi:hypothetical protein